VTSRVCLLKACRAKTSVIAHSMGNYVLQCALQVCWTRKNQPLLTSLLNQLPPMTPRRLVCLGSLMVAADVDNDLFKSGETTDKSDGDAIANLTYRVTALYSGLDTTLGQPRLGRDAAVVCGNPPLPANRTP
jgi:esterase/lipase superfamily enzyme